MTKSTPSSNPLSSSLSKVASINASDKTSVQQGKPELRQGRKRKATEEQDAIPDQAPQSDVVSDLSDEEAQALAGEDASLRPTDQAAEPVSAVVLAQLQAVTGLIPVGGLPASALPLGALPVAAIPQTALAGWGTLVSSLAPAVITPMASAVSAIGTMGGAAVVANQAAGGTSMEFDTTPPEAPTVNALSTNDSTPVLTGTATLLAGETLEVTLNGATYSLSGPLSGAWSIDTGTVTPTSGTLGSFTSGQSYEVSAVAKDALGNSATDTNANELYFDTTPPVWSVSVTPTSVDEGAGSISFTVTRSVGTSLETIQFATGGGSAAAGSDYTAATQTLSFAAGVMSRTVTVAVTDDVAPEANETLLGMISNASAGSIQTNSAEATVNDNEQSIWSVGTTTSVVDEGAGTITFVVSRTGATAAASIDFATGGGSATAGSDYTAATQTLSFAAGEMSKTISVSVITDTLLEPNETFFVSIGGASEGTIDLGTASATITDPLQSVWSIGSGSSALDEGAGFAVFTVSRTGATNAESVRVVAGGGDAVPGVDYAAFNQVLNFAAGEMNKTIRIAITDDSQAEMNETFSATLTDLSAGTTANAVSMVTINDNDQSLWSVTSNGSVSEGAGVTSFVVSRTGQSAAAQVTFNVGGGTASMVNDYTSGGNQVLNFAAGEMSKTINVTVNNDNLLETEERFTASISNQSTGVVVQGSSVMSIVDDDQPTWSISRNSSEVLEGAGSVTYTITRTGAPDAASIVFSTQGVTAVAPVDYIATTQTINFANGEMTKTVTVALTTDFLEEPDKSFLATISLPTGASGNISTSTVSTSIVDDDAMQWRIDAGPNALESSGFLTFTVTRVGNLNAASTINFLAGDGLATADVDFVANSQTLSFLAGEASKTVYVSISDDALVEPNESITGVIYNPASGIIKQAKATGVVLDDEQSVWTVSAPLNTVMEDAGFAVVEVKRTGKLDVAGQITLSANGQMSTKGVDWTWEPTVLFFAANEASKMVFVPVVNDGVIEQREVVFFDLSNASTGVIGSLFVADAGGGGAPEANQVSINIIDPQSVSWTVSAAAPTVMESAGMAAFLVSRDNVSSAGTIRFTTAGLSTAFYTPVDTVLSFAIGEQSKLVNVALTNDSMGTGNRTLTALLLDPSIGTISSAQLASNSGNASTTIVDDDQMSWSVSTNAGQIDESSGNLNFVITRTGSLAAATIDFATIGGTAVPGLDYHSLHQTISFEAGQTSYALQVNVLDDTVAQSSNTIVGWIGNNSAGSIVSSSATGTLTDNDQPLWALSARGVVDEGTGNLWYSVSRTTGLTAATIEFTGVMVDQRGVQQTVSQTLSFAVGEVYKSVFVPVVDDSLPASTLGAWAQLTNPSVGAVIRGSIGVGVNDNDTAEWMIRPQTNPSEGAMGALTIYRSGSPVAATVKLSISSSIALTSDFDATNLVRTISFAEGEMAKMVPISTLLDSVSERPEAVRYSLIDPSVGAIGLTFNSVEVTIADLNLTAPVFTASAAAGYEEQGYVAVTVTRAGLTTGTARSITPRPLEPRWRGRITRQYRAR